MRFCAGLETLGTGEYALGGQLYCGVFEESAVQHVTLPSTLRKIEYNAFRCCENLYSIRLPRRVEIIGRCCFSRSEIKRLTFPSSVREVGAEAFMECKQLKSVRLNEGLKKLGETMSVCREKRKGKVFTNSAIRSVKIPSTLKTVEAETFSGCEKLARVKL